MTKDEYVHKIHEIKNTRHPQDWYLYFVPVMKNYIDSLESQLVAKAKEYDCYWHLKHDNLNEQNHRLENCISRIRTENGKLRKATPESYQLLMARYKELYMRHVQDESELMLDVQRISELESQLASVLADNKQLMEQINHFGETIEPRQKERVK